MNSTKTGVAKNSNFHQENSSAMPDKIKSGESTSKFCLEKASAKRKGMLKKAIPHFISIKWKKAKSIVNTPYFIISFFITIG